MNSCPSIQETLDAFIRAVKGSKSENTFEVYRQGIKTYTKFLLENGVNLSSKVSELSPTTIIRFVEYCKAHRLSSDSERLYLSVVSMFFQFLLIEDIGLFNIEKVRMIIKQYGRKKGKKLIKYPKLQIEKIIQYAEQLSPSLDLPSHRLLTELRNRALILTLADTGLRIQEACHLKRGDMNFDEGIAFIIGKGNKEAKIRFSARSLQAIKDYLLHRDDLDKKSSSPLVNLPVFARHNINTRRCVLTITSETGEAIVETMKRRVLGEDANLYKITPHSFRHRFITEIVSRTGNLKLAQDLARHSSISATVRYTHLCDDEINKGYTEVFG